MHWTGRKEEGEETSMVASRKGVQGQDLEGIVDSGQPEGGFEHPRYSATLRSRLRCENVETGRPMQRRLLSGRMACAKVSAAK